MVRGPSPEGLDWDLSTALELQWASFCLEIRAVGAEVEACPQGPTTVLLFVE